MEDCAMGIKNETNIYNMKNDINRNEKNIGEIFGKLDDIRDETVSIIKSLLTRGVISMILIVVLKEVATWAFK